MRFNEEEKLTIIAEGQKAGVRAICAKYDISDQTYRDWRYKTLGIKPRKHLSSAKRLRVLGQYYASTLAPALRLELEDQQAYRGRPLSSENWNCSITIDYDGQVAREH